MREYRNERENNGRIPALSLCVWSSIYCFLSQSKRASPEFLVSELQCSAFSQASGALYPSWEIPEYGK